MRPSRWVLAVLLPLALGAAAALPRLSFDHDTRSLLRTDAAEDEHESELARRFGSEDILLVAWEVDDALDPVAFARLRGIANELAAVEGLEEVYSLASPTVLLPLSPDALPRPLREADLADGGDRARVAAALRAAPVYLGTIYNEELTVVAVAGTLRPGPRAARERVIRDVRAIAARHARDGRPLHVSGVTALALAASEYALADLRDVGLSALVVAVLVLWLLCGSGRETLVAVVATGLPPLLALGLAAACGWPVTALGAALFPVLAVVGITSTIHLLNAYAEDRDAWRAARRLARPVTLSLATTALAFAGLRASGIPAFEAAGTLVGAGVLLAIPVVLLGVPAMLDVARPTAGPRLAARLDRPLALLARAVIRAPRRVLAVAVIVAVACVPLVRAAPVHVDVLQAFDDGSEVARTYRFLEERLTATLPVDLVVESGSGADAATALEDLRAFEKEALSLEGVESALGLQSLVDYGRSITSLPEPATLVFLRTALAHVTERFEHRATGSYRVKLRIREGTPPSVLDRLEEARRRTIRSESWLTGLYVRAVKTTRAIVADLAAATLAMVLVVSLVVGAAFRSVRFALAACAANLLPPLVVFGGAAALGAPLDISAVAVGGVAVGLAVDDTIHLLHAVRRADGPLRDALLSAQRSVGRALVLSTVVLAAGLACLATSRFLPTARFGALAASACVVALLADLLVVPAALLLRRHL